ncbi:MAG TPA: response regulator, partial [Hyphomicrobium sp.]|nr:response regulator [Hyphomicrobium sp.]
TAQMLAFSRRQKLEPRALDLNETVRGMRDLLQSTIGASVRIEPPDLTPDLWPAMIDPTQIELVILNLAINARDAMEVGGSLQVRTANVVTGEPRRPEEPAAGEYVMVSVSDTGSGMTDEVLAKAFEPFFTTKDVGKGSGLGLSQAYGLAKQSGGGVSIETELGHGTTIKVYLPRAKSETATTTAGVAIRGSAREEAQGRIVLVVDDDEAVREVTSAILADFGYSVVEAGSAGAALELFERRNDIAAALLDFAMPGMNGVDLARELRNRRPGTPILFATGFADADALKGVGDDDIIRKPYDASELAAKLGRRLPSIGQEPAVRPRDVDGSKVTLGATPKS